MSPNPAVLTWPRPAGGGGAGSVSGAYITTVASASNASTYTFTSVGLGDPAADRRIHVAISVRKAEPAATITAVTIGGVAATQDVANAQGGTTNAILSAAVPAGTTGTVVVTTSTGVLRCHVHVYRTTGASSTPAGVSKPPETQTAEFSLTSTPDGYAIAITANNGTANTVTWTGATGDAIDTTEHRSETGSTVTTATTTDIDAAWSSTSTAFAHAAVAYQPD